MEYKLIALIGKAGSGKDTLMKEILKQYDPYIHEIISCTTRSPRDYEVDGVNYYFLSIENFTSKVINGQMLESTEFNGWFYGTSLDSLCSDKINIGVFNPAGIRAIRKSNNVDMRVFLIDTNDKIRLLRQLNREDNPNVKEIVRRFYTDEEDFKNIKEEFQPYIIKNNNDPIWAVASRITKQCYDWINEARDN